MGCCHWLVGGRIEVGLKVELGVLGSTTWSKFLGEFVVIKAVVRRGGIFGLGKGRERRRWLVLEDFVMI